LFASGSSRLSKVYDIDNIYDLKFG
jgi:hypothetical protein